MSSLMKNLVGIAAIGVTCSANTPQRPASGVEMRQRIVLEDLAKDKNVDLDKIVKGWKPWEYHRETGIQRSIDSLAYKQLFDGTELVKDSAAVEEFNSIAAKNAPHPRHSFYTIMQTDFNKRLKALGCSDKEVYRLSGACTEVYPRRDCGEIHFTSEGTINAVARHQYYTDSVAYNKFFDSKGILNKSMKQKIAYISRKIKP